MARPVRIQHHLLFVAFAAVVCSQLVLNVAAAKERWESGKNSFEDPEYDPEATSSEDQSEEPPEQLVVCEADEKPRISCTCDKTSPVTLKCGGAKLETARLYVAEDFGVALQVAHLERNEITSLSKNRILPGQEKSLQTLDLAHNKIDAIQPGAFDPFASLLELKLSHNRLDELSDDIFTPQMGSLRQLYLDHNFISKLDDGVFDNLNSLTKLVLDGNARIKLSNKVFTSALAKLEVLSLDHCHLDDTLDAELFANLLNLRALSLSGNNLNSVPLAVGPAKLPALQVLAMSDTYLHSLENTALAERVPKLQKLYMRRMKYLEKIDDCAFCKLPNLEVLDFSDSPKLAQIDANAFGTTLPASLRQLNFKNCNISSLAEGLLPNSYFGTLKALRLGGNPWNCGCQLKWLLDNDRAIRLASEFEEPTCTAPESLKGISFYKAHDHLEKTCGPPSDGASPMGMFVVLLVSMVLAASLLVFGVFYARRRFQLAGFGEGGSGNFRVPEFLGGGSFQRASFSAGRNIFDDELEDVGDQHEEETGHHDAAVAAGQRPRAEFV